MTFENVKVFGWSDWDGGKLKFTNQLISQGI